MITDLSSELPIWILSAYGPGLKAPIQLFGGEDREKSFEEMRLNHYALRAQGQEALAVCILGNVIPNCTDLVLGTPAGRINSEGSGTKPERPAQH